MATSNEEEPVILERSSRITRGKRMTKLLDDEVEEDEQFWNQDALKEDENDIIYEAEVEIADEFDSDFDEDEPELDEEVDNDADHRERKRKRLIYPGKPVTKKKNKKKVLSKLESVPNDEKASHEQQSNLHEHQDVPDDLEGERIVRKSTRTSVIVRQVERDIRAALQAAIKKQPIKRRKEGEEKRMTQEEMLLEAAQTEIVNLRNLERVLAREEEVKKRAVVHKVVYSGPQIRYSSKNGKLFLSQSFLEFSKGLSFQSELCTTPVPYPQKAVCAITGLPAKYRDPKTGKPYATKEAFKILRKCFSDENNKVKKEKDMGVLFDSISGQGFLVRQKRSVISNASETSYLRYWARFRRIPALEIQTLD
ncbi:hypothetical protein HHK36_017999 [Tetracentron sinense]|uniref:Vps72/YL1 C-terminal domain-containing protein n=1 Tax=Tetracentron sinense TaxID=13715 RepID=A0A834Z3U7_TETSI|nr:hypothetical protein HHK36_017999 [Tetracentron sinense]